MLERLRARRLSCSVRRWSSRVIPRGQGITRLLTGERRDMPDRALRPSPPRAGTGPAARPALLADGPDMGSGSITDARSDYEGAADIVISAAHNAVSEEFREHKAIEALARTQAPIDRARTAAFGLTDELRRWALADFEVNQWFRVAPLVYKANEIQEVRRRLGVPQDQAPLSSQTHEGRGAAKARAHWAGAPSSAASSPGCSSSPPTSAAPTPIPDPLEQRDLRATGRCRRECPDPGRPSPKVQFAGIRAPLHPRRA
jgi:hypothetical protein